MKNLCIPPTFPKNLKELRLMGGISQKELGEMAGYGQNHVSYWEHGKVFPGIEALMTLAAIFDVSLDALLYYPNSAKGRCNTVCLNFKRVVRAERKMLRWEMFRWREIEKLLVDFMQIEAEEIRHRYLVLVEAFINDLHDVAVNEIANETRGISI